METQQYKRTLAGSVGAGMGAIFNGGGRTYYILEHKTETQYHHIGESQKIIVDQVELGRDSSCQVRFDESCETVSRKHAAIVRDGDNWKLIPLSQTNATFINGQRITQEQILQSGDEIKLSSHGPVMGFIVPQGKQSLVSSIGMTERLNLFRQQALRPYKTALWVMGIVLILAIAGLIAWNLYEKKENQKVVGELNEQINEQKRIAEEQDARAAELQIQLENESQEREKVAEQLEQAKKESGERAQAIQDSLQKVLEAKDAQIAEVSQAAKSAANSAYAANKRAKELRQEVDKIQEEAAAEAKKAEPATTEEGTSAATVHEEESIVTHKSIEEQLKEAEENVYYIKINRITVTDNRNTQILEFNTERKIGGTGFMMNDGRFITARRVIEPWFYYKGGVVGDDKNGNEWFYDDLQWLANNGCRITSEFTAYSPSGESFTFRNTDFQFHQFKETLSDDFAEKYDPRRYAKRFVDKANVKYVYWYGTDYRNDWAVRRVKKSEDGLKADNSFSARPVAGTKVWILGYPDERNLNSMDVEVTQKANTVNSEGLNINGVVELASRRWVEGYDGAPVLIDQDGELKVIGILSYSDKSNRDIVTPVHTVGNK